jgi:hypothetical protein
MRWILNIVRRRRMNGEIGAEVDSHIEERVSDLMEAGMSERESRQKANRDFGSATLYREAGREAWGWTSLGRDDDPSETGIAKGVPAALAAVVWRAIWCPACCSD